MDIPAAEQRLTVSEEDDLLGALEALARRSVREEPDEDGEEVSLAPVHLAKQQVLIEKAIRDVFKAVSQKKLMKFCKQQRLCLIFRRR